ncbi:uncharacterized protein LOC143203632 [Rhynchophorus ferrugineus]|uniref:uncharacterized protein LOC143203632 n=1 Tax=Rhynchophorus ferrugineus TaxID=354439 RepID=UPI003FCD5DC9
MRQTYLPRRPKLFSHNKSQLTGDLQFVRLTVEAVTAFVSFFIPRSPATDRLSIDDAPVLRVLFRTDHVCFNSNRCSILIPVEIRQRTVSITFFLLGTAVRDHETVRFVEKTRFH